MVVLEGSQPSSQPHPLELQLPGVPLQNSGWVLAAHWADKPEPVQHSAGAPKQRPDTAPDAPSFWSSVEQPWVQVVLVFQFASGQEPLLHVTASLYFSCPPTQVSGTASRHSCPCSTVVPPTVQDFSLHFRVLAFQVYPVAQSHWVFPLVAPSPAALVLLAGQAVQVLLYTY